MFAKMSASFMAVGVVFAIMCINSCQSSTFITPRITHPAYPGQCFEPVTLSLVAPGRDLYLPHGCMKLTCLRDLRFGGVGCASEEAIGRNCRQVAGDRRLHYPHCCPRYVCDEPRDSDLVEYGENNL